MTNLKKSRVSTIALYLSVVLCFFATAINVWAGLAGFFLVLFSVALSVVEDGLTKITAIMQTLADDIEDMS